ncbi:hypothetical protein BKA01_005070 [Pseudonocardia eucalypti]|nr:hypothetical protein [Pseudonocardia eucalypti]
MLAGTFIVLAVAIAAGIAVAPDTLVTTHDAAGCRALRC